MPLDIDVFIPPSIEQRNQLLALVVCVIMNHQAEITVNSGHEPLCPLFTLARLQFAVVKVYASISSTECTFRNVYTVRLNHCTDIEHTMLIRLYVNLFGMKIDV